MGEWIDITRRLYDGMTGWPGDPPLRFSAVADLETDGVKVTEVIDHHWLQSIYFQDPNDLRVELSYRSIGPEFFEQHKHDPHDTLDQWTKQKKN